MRYRSRFLVTALAFASLSPNAGAASPATAVPPPERRADPQPGSPDSGDSLFPQDGNGGYDVRHYAISLRWRLDGTISASTTIIATATQDLSSFNLDLHELSVAEVLVDGAVADISTHSDSDELEIAPAQPLLTGARFTAVVRYDGTPSYVIDPDGSKDGWIPTSDGATVLAEPVGAKTWFPCNNTPADKATYAIAVTAPNGKAVAANGRLVRRDHIAHATTWHWRESQPMATYLASVSIGDFDVVTGKSRRGVPLRSFIDAHRSGAHTARKVGAVIDHWASVFGPYPFASAGIIVDDVPVNFALEVQTRPVFPYDPGVGTWLAHELAHQWFGDSVTPRDWSDIWLNEGFATYAEWLWLAHTGRSGPVREFHRLYRENPKRAPFWDDVVTNPTPETLFREDLVYKRAAMALQALRIRIGSRDFFELVRRWADRLEYANATTARFEAMAERVSGRSLDALFGAWLHSSGKPSLP